MRRQEHKSAASKVLLLLFKRDLMSFFYFLAKKKATPAPKKCENAGECSNENVCCPLWALRGDCTKAFDYMSCNCKISCCKVYDA